MTKQKLEKLVQNGAMGLAVILVAIALSWEVMVIVNRNIGYDDNDVTAAQQMVPAEARPEQGAGLKN